MKKFKAFMLKEHVVPNWVIVIDIIVYSILALVIIF